MQRFSERAIGGGVVREIEFFNLDAILSVGYRVNSKCGTQFRIWATRTLRDHLLRGYTLHERRLRERGLGELELLARTLTVNALVRDEGCAVLDVVQQYSWAWRLLLEYDEQRLAELPARPVAPKAGMSLEKAREMAARLRANRAGEQAIAPQVLQEQQRADALASPTTRWWHSHS